MENTKAIDVENILSLLKYSTDITEVGDALEAIELENIPISAMVEVSKQAASCARNFFATKLVGYNRQDLWHLDTIYKFYYKLNEYAEKIGANLNEQE